MKLAFIRLCSLWFLATLLVLLTCEPALGQLKKGGPDEAAAAAAATGILGGVALLWGGGCCGSLLLFILAIAYPIWFYLTLYKAFDSISPHNRDMEPANTFLLLIPGFNIVWYFIVVNRLASSFRKEFNERGLEADHDFGLLFGILAPLIPCAGLVLMPIWLLKQRGFTAQLTGGNAGGKKKKIADDDDE